MSSTAKVFVDGVTSYAAADANGMKNENSNAIEAAGIVLHTGDNDQTAEAMSVHSAGADSYTDSGSSNAHVLTIAASVVSFIPGKAYFAGMRMRFLAGFAPTGATTVNASGIGVINVFNNGSALVGGEYNTGDFVEIEHDGTQANVVRVSRDVTVSQLPSGHLTGIKLENAADADHDITFNTGKCRDDADTFSIDFSNALTKQIDVAFATGDNAGGLASGTVAVDETYHCFAISTPGGVEDAIFDISETGANIAAAAPTFTKTRRVGYVITDASANIIPGLWTGNKWTPDSPIQEYSASESTSATTRTFANAPAGIKSNLGVVVRASQSSATANGIRYSDPDQPEIAAVESNSQINGDGTGSTLNQTVNFEITTNTSSQVRTEAEFSGTTVQCSIMFVIDSRGQD